MRILLFHTPPDLYGASRSLLRLTSGLSAGGHSVFVALPEEGTLAAPLRAAGAEVVTIPGFAFVSRQVLRTLRDILCYPWRLLTSCLRTLSLVRRIKPDLIHSNTALLPPAGIVAKIMGIPHVCHVREFFTEFGILWRAYGSFLSFTSDCIICVSHAVASQFRPSVRLLKVRVIHNGFPADEFCPVAQDRIRKFRDQFQLDEQPLVGVVGRIKFGRKGQDVFVKAAALLRPKFPRVKFLCIGSPFPGNEEHLRRLSALVEQLQLTGTVICTGDVEDIKGAYAALEVSIQAATGPEPFAGVVIESMAMAKAIVATATGGTPEQIEDGVSGLLVSPGDERALAEAIETLLLSEDLRCTLGRAAREKFEREFLFEKFYHSLLSVYASILEAR